MEVIEVSGKKTRNEFYKMPEGIYRNDPNYTPLLRPMIENTFHPQKKRQI